MMCTLSCPNDCFAVETALRAAHQCFVSMLSHVKNHQMTVAMKTTQLLLTILICASTASRALAGNYTVALPNGFTAFALQVLPATSSSSASGAGFNEVAPGFNTPGEFDGCLLYIPDQNNSDPCFDGYTIYTVDSFRDSGWGNTTDTAQSAEPILTLGQGSVRGWDHTSGFGHPCRDLEGHSTAAQK